MQSAPTLSGGLVADEDVWDHIDFFLKPESLWSVLSCSLAFCSRIFSGSATGLLFGCFFQEVEIIFLYKWCFRKSLPFPLVYTIASLTMCVCVVRSVVSDSKSDPVNWSSLDSSVHGILQARTLEWVAVPFSRDLPNPETKPTSPASAGRFFTTVPPGEPFSNYTWNFNDRKSFKIFFLGIFCDVGQWLPASHMISRVNSWCLYNHSVPRQPCCFSFSVQFSVNYMSYSTLHYKIGFVWDDFAWLEADKCSEHILYRLDWTLMFSKLGVLNAFSTLGIFKLQNLRKICINTENWIHLLSFSFHILIFFFFFFFCL